MTILHSWRLVTIPLLVVLPACSKPEPVANAAAQPSDAEPAVARTACAMVSAAEMSTIVGAPVVAEGENGVGTTTCRYKPAERSLPYAELKVDWGNAAAAMAASGILSRLEPGIGARLAGLGDQASAMGPVLMVRTGEDLVNLTLMGVDDNVATAKRILAVMRPRMGPSAQAGARADASASDEAAAKAAEVVSGLLQGLADQQGQKHDQKDRSGGADRSDGESPALADDAVFAPAAGPAVRIPLVAGLTLVGAENEPARGDYEPITTVSAVTNDAVSTVFSANLPEGRRLQVPRILRRHDLQQARRYLSWYRDGDPETFAGATSFSVSAAVYQDLKTKGQAVVARLSTDSDPLLAIAALVAGGTQPQEHRGLLTRIEPHAVAFPVLVNDEPAQLHAIHARGTFDDATIDFHVLDDPDNPILLRVAGGSVGRVVRITFPASDVAPIEEKLKRSSRVELHGIYFDFGQATLRPESEPVLRDIAAALAHNPDWTINIEGHTDDIGGDAMNLDLSRRRADAVKQALVGRYRLSASKLATAGFGAARPNASNDTMAGRARNRRVELVRQ